MSYSIMEALFSGRIVPWERRVPMTTESRKIADKIENEKRYFMEKMSLDDYQRLETLEDLYAEAAFEEETDTYSHGFTLGALLMQEVMEKKQAMISE